MSWNQRLLLNNILFSQTSSTFHQHQVININIWKRKLNNNYLHLKQFIFNICHMKPEMPWKVNTEKLKEGVKTVKDDVDGRYARLSSLKNKKKRKISFHNFSRVFTCVCFFPSITCSFQYYLFTLFFSLCKLKRFPSKSQKIRLKMSASQGLKESKR